MDRDTLNHVIDCLGDNLGMTHYYQDKYAVDLLKMVLSGRGIVRVRELKNSRWSRLLKRPILSNVVANCGSGLICPNSLDQVSFNTFEPIILTLGEWKRHQYSSSSQTTRQGSSLVLQLNLSSYWAHKFYLLTGYGANKFFDIAHPVSTSREMTLAWVRIDVDFNTDEALIEEIQSDLVRWISHLGIASKNAKPNHTLLDFYGNKIDIEDMISFSNEFNTCFGSLWAQASLSCAINFIRETLGISNIYYHTFKSGNILKCIRMNLPPRSIYTELPKSFCFTKQECAPAFLKSNKSIKKKLDRVRGSGWFYLPL